MPITHYLPVGTTEAQVFTAQIDGAVSDMTGTTPTLQIWDKNGRALTVSGTVVWSSPTLAQWSYTPDGQLIKSLSPYSVRLSVDDGSSVAKFPNGEDPDTWWVVDP